MNNLKLKNMLVIILILMSINRTIPVFAEGTTTNAALKASNSQINIGKSFTLSLVLNGDSFDLAGFETTIKFDSSKINIVKENSEVKVIKPSSIPGDFGIIPNIIEDGVVKIIGFINPSSTSAKPINVRGETSIFALEFTVKDSAEVNTKAIFEILDITIGSTYLDDRMNVFANKADPISVTIGPKLDTNNFLSSLSVEGYTLSPAFARAVYDYKITVPVDVTSITVNAQRESSTSTHAISGAGNLNYGDNLVTVTVTAQDKDLVRRYRITVTRQFPPVETSEEPTPSETAETPSISEYSEEITPTVEATPTLQPVSSESEEESSSEIVEKLPGTDNYWKTIAIISTALFLICAGVMVWLIIDKISNKNKIVRIKRK